MVCDEEEVDAGIKIKHRDRYTFFPKNRLTEEVLDGPITGSTFDLRLIDDNSNSGYDNYHDDLKQTTKLVWDFTIKPTSLKLRIIGLLRGRSIVQRVADDYCRQLGQYAETLEKQK